MVSPHQTALCWVPGTLKFGTIHVEAIQKTQNMQAFDYQVSLALLLRHVGSTILSKEDIPAPADKPLTLTIFDARLPEQKDTFPWRHPGSRLEFSLHNTSSMPDTWVHFFCQWETAPGWLQWFFSPCQPRRPEVARGLEPLGVFCRILELIIKGEVMYDSTQAVGHPDAHRIVWMASKPVRAELWRDLRLVVETQLDRAPHETRLQWEAITDQNGGQTGLGDFGPLFTILRGAHPVIEGAARDGGVGSVLHAAAFQECKWQLAAENRSHQDPALQALMEQADVTEHSEQEWQAHVHDAKPRELQRLLQSNRAACKSAVKHIEHMILDLEQQHVDELSLAKTMSMSPYQPRSRRW